MQSCSRKDDHVVFWEEMGIQKGKVYKRNDFLQSCDLIVDSIRGENMSYKDLEK